MRFLLSCVGTRGDVQPILAVAFAVRSLGHDVRLCVPPNFVQWSTDLGFEAHPVGVEMRQPPPKAGGAPPPPLTAEQLKKLMQQMPDLVTDQFEKVGAAAVGCGAILGGNAHQYAARSVAELHGIPYMDALYAPVAIPSADHAPPPPPGQGWEPGLAADNAALWTANRQAWNTRALERVNANRGRLGLAPIHDVLDHVLTERPWLATDAILGPAPTTPALEIFQTGAWILEDGAPLADDLVRFLDAGAPPVYVGFGSMPASPTLGPTILGAVRSTGRRVVMSRGWAGLDLDGATEDCFVVDDVNQQALFPRVAAVIHHGGAGTTATAARAATPQIITPMFGDQFYWGHRVRTLGIGTTFPHGGLIGPGLTEALAQVLGPQPIERAREVATALTSEGAMVAARALVESV